MKDRAAEYLFAIKRKYALLQPLAEELQKTEEALNALLSMEKQADASASDLEAWIAAVARAPFPRKVLLKNIECLEKEISLLDESFE